MAQNLSWTSIALQDLEAIWNRICELGDEREAGLQLEFIHRNIEVGFTSATSPWTCTRGQGALLPTRNLVGR